MDMKFIAQRLSCATLCVFLGVAFAPLVARSESLDSYLERFDEKVDLSKEIKVLGAVACYRHLGLSAHFGSYLVTLFLISGGEDRAILSGYIVHKDPSGVSRKKIVKLEGDEAMALLRSIQKSEIFVLPRHLSLLGDRDFSAEGESRISSFYYIFERTDGVTSRVVGRAQYASYPADLLAEPFRKLVIAEMELVDESGKEEEKED